MSKNSSPTQDDQAERRKTDPKISSNKSSKTYKCMTKLLKQLTFKKDCFDVFRGSGPKGAPPRTSPGTLQGPILFKFVRKDVFEMLFL